MQIELLEFVEALSHTDHVIMADIYAARETDTLGVSSKQIADELKECGLAKFMHDFYVYDVEGNCVER